jgi:hypothetical protein
MSSFSGLATRFIKRHQNLLITISLVLVALPFVALSFFNHPALDDFLDAVMVKELGFWSAQKSIYFSHTGRYSTTLLLALVNPLIYGHMENHWWPVTLGFLVGTLLVLRFYVGLLPGISTMKAWRGAGVLLGLWLAFAPGQAEGLYWFTGAYTYLATAWLLLLWLGVLVRYVEARRNATPHTVWLLLLIGLTVAVAGSTEPVALPFLVVLLAGAGMTWRYSRHRWVVVLLACLAFTGSMISFAAPGNFVRMGSMGESFGIFKTLLYSGATAGYLLLTWVSNPVLLVVSALLLPSLYRAAQLRDYLLVHLLSRIPAGFLAGGLALLLAAANCPAYYASGTGLPLRARNTLYLLFLAGWFVVLLMWCCRRARQKQFAIPINALLSSRLQPFWLALLLLFFFSDYNVQTRSHLLGNGSNNVIRAYHQWLSGEAAHFDAELRTRYRKLAAGGPIVAIVPLHSRPEMLYSFGVADTVNSTVLQNYARYFDVPKVVVSGASENAKLRP